MSFPRLTLRQWIGWFGFGLVFLLTAATAVWRGDILRAGLDPQVPFQTYAPPPAPDYDQPAAWVLRDARAPGAGGAAVFFVHSTTYEGGRHWNGPVGTAQGERWLREVVIPNYAGPFARAGAVSAPRYRQASLYTRLTLREDARDARAFAYQDIVAAFEAWLERHPEGPIVLAGVEQGGELVERLARERVATDPALRARLVAVYLMDVVAAADRRPAGLPACERRDLAGCVVAFSPVGEGNDGAARRRLRRALVWDARGRLVELDDRTPLCVNPLTGSTDTAPIEARAHRGATNATGLEWGAHPALMTREVAAQCRDGLLRHTEPNLESFRETGSWADRRKSRPYNLFYGDLEADVQARLAAWQARGSA
ncbi:DUF3089 domain-containing protein [Brevundimonas sp.]|uniref:DUF3089 domain-containing protein n=1 Tax=Brevundimonas sp. TaxID=1871086 RepID=UPI0035B48E42